MTGPGNNPLGLIAGGGDYPAYVLAALKARGRSVVVVGFRGETSRRILRAGGRSLVVRFGEVRRVIRFLRACGVREAVMAGYVSHRRVISRPRLDSLAARVLSGLADRRADTLLKAAALHLRLSGIRLVSAMPYLQDLIPVRGTLTRRGPTFEQWRDIRFGAGIARGVAGLDVGQTVVVRNRAVIAVEAMEGTDAAIRRAGRLGKAGIVVVKVAKPQQDFRFDVPVVGVRTVASLKAARAAVLAVEAGKTLLLGPAEVTAGADRAGVAVVAI